MSARVLAAVAAVLCVGLIEAAHSEDKISLRYGEIANSARGVSAVAIHIAQRQGFLEREGIDFKVVGLRGTSFQVEELDKGNVEVVNTAMPYLIQAVLKGSNSVGIAGGPANQVYSLIAKPEIKTVAELKGKVVGLADEAGTIAISMRKLLALHGLRHGDFGVKVIEGTPTRWACLHRGDCDAVVLGQPQDLLAMKEGFRLLGVSNDAVPELLYTVTAVRRSWADAHKDAVTRYVRALAAAFGFIRDPANRDRVMRTIVETTGASDLIAGQTLDLFFRPERGVLPRRGEIELKGLQEVIALMGEAGNLKAPLPSAERFVDTQYLRAAGVQ